MTPALDDTVAAGAKSPVHVLAVGTLLPGGWGTEIGLIVLLVVAMTWVGYLVRRRGR